MPLDEKGLRHDENALRLVARTFTPAEVADLREMKAGEHQQSSSPRLAACRTTQTAYQAVNGMKFGRRGGHDGTD